MYLAHPRETKGAWMGGANTPVRGVSWPRKRSRIHDLWGQATKCMWWMPWRLQAMKDVAACEKLRGAGKRALIRRYPKGKPSPQGLLPPESIGWVEQTR